VGPIPLGLQVSRLAPCRTASVRQMGAHADVPTSELVLCRGSTHHALPKPWFSPGLPGSAFCSALPMAEPKVAHLCSASPYACLPSPPYTDAPCLPACLPTRSFDTFVETYLRSSCEGQQVPVVANCASKQTDRDADHSDYKHLKCPTVCAGDGYTCDTCGWAWTKPGASVFYPIFSASPFREL